MMYKRHNKIKNFTIDFNRMDEEDNLRRPDGRKIEYGVNAIGYWKSAELLAMACEDIVPDGSYSDFECQIWELYRMILRREKKIES